MKTLESYNPDVSANKEIKSIQKPHTPIFIRFFSGLLGSTISSFICSPLDLIKVRLQVSYEKGAKQYKSFIDAIKTVYREEKLRGFFKGTKVAVVTVPIFYSLYFPLYESSKTFYAKLIYKDYKKVDSFIFTISAASSGFICDLITNPMWVVRIRYQTEFIYSGSQKMDSFNVLKSIRKLYKKEGFFALYRGLIASLLGIPHGIIQFNMYENLKNFFINKYKTEDLPYSVIFFISIISKTTASLCTYPHEVIRNNLQNVRDYEIKHMSLFHLIRNIYGEKGIAGFYGGFKINLIRILPNTAIMFTCYEFITDSLTNAYYRYKI